jgi:hypothetical protein
VQTDPHERLLAVLLQFVHFRQRGGVHVFAGEPLAIHLDTAVHHRPGDRHMYAPGFRADRLVFDPAQGGWLRAKGRHRGTSRPCPRHPRLVARDATRPMPGERCLREDQGLLSGARSAK